MPTATYRKSHEAGIELRPSDRDPTLPQPSWPSGHADVAGGTVLSKAGPGHRIRHVNLMLWCLILTGREGPEGGWKITVMVTVQARGDRRWIQGRTMKMMVNVLCLALDQAHHTPYLNPQRNSDEGAASLSPTRRCGH